MELTSEDYRSMVYYDFRLGLTQQECIDRLKKTFGNEAPSKTMVEKWYTEFQHNQSTDKHDTRADHPK